MLQPIIENPEAPCTCGDCEWTGPASELQLISHLSERVGAGEDMPAGECPECGALAHLDDDAPDLRASLTTAYATLVRTFDLPRDGDASEALMGELSPLARRAVSAFVLLWDAMEENDALSAPSV